MQPLGSLPAPVVSQALPQDHPRLFSTSLTGLPHVQEEFVADANDILKVGQELAVRVKDVKPDGTIRLSLKPKQAGRPRPPGASYSRVTSGIQQIENSQLKVNDWLEGVVVRVCPSCLSKPMQRQDGL